ELIIILAIVLIIFGAGKLPQNGEGGGKALRGFKKEVNDIPPPADTTPTQMNQPSPTHNQPTAPASPAPATMPGPTPAPRRRTAHTRRRRGGATPPGPPPLLSAQRAQSARVGPAGARDATSTGGAGPAPPDEEKPRGPPRAGQGGAVPASSSRCSGET